jgi:hypothetical protein
MKCFESKNYKYFEKIELEIADGKCKRKILKFSSSSNVFLSNNVSKPYSFIMNLTCDGSKNRFIKRRDFASSSKEYLFSVVILSIAI